MRVFGFSITYVTLLFAAMTVDILVLSDVCVPAHAGRGWPLLGWRLVARTQPMVQQGPPCPVRGNSVATGRTTKVTPEPDLR